MTKSKQQTKDVVVGGKIAQRSNAADSVQSVIGGSASEVEQVIGTGAEVRSKPQIRDTPPTKHLFKWDFFIAHADRDLPAAEMLYDSLQPHSRPFLDKRCLRLGDNWDTKLAEAQKNSLITVVLVSGNTDNAYYEREEIAAAIMLSRTNEESHRVVPVYLDSDALRNSVPYGLRLKHGVTLSDETRLQEVGNQLIELLQSLSAKGAPTINDKIEPTSRIFQPQLKYYIYISDTKINMLSSQLGRASPQQDRFASLNAVLKFLRDSGHIGTVDNPREYFEGCLSMRWGPYGGRHSEETPLIYFGAVTDNVILGLAGSAHHVIGNCGTSSAHSHSHTPYMMEYIGTDLELKEPSGLPFRFSGKKKSDRTDMMVMRAVCNATTLMEGPEQKLEFVAKRLNHGSANQGMKVLLGTPIYVALID